MVRHALGPKVPRYPDRKHTAKAAWLLRWAPVVFLWWWMLFLAGIHVRTIESFYDERGSDRLNLIGGAGGVSEYMWRMQLRCAPTYCGRVTHFGTEIATQPPYQHCAAEGICR